MTSAYTSIDDIDDVVIAGTGGAGLRTALGWPAPG
jgi:hypothetical protein